MHCDRWQVVAVPFPFSERPGAKRRPALVLSNGSFNRAGHTVLAMITTAGHARMNARHYLTEIPHFSEPSLGGSGAHFENAGPTP